MSNFLTTTRKFIYDMIPVMIGVFLGFSLNNFAENKKLQKHLVNLDKMLQLEILNNQENINHTYDYHAQLKKDLEVINKSDDIMKAVGAFQFKGLRPGNIDQSAFETGVQTGIIQEMEIHKVLNINKLYNLQKSYSSFNESMMSAILNKDFPQTENETEKFVTSLIMNMNDELGFEGRLKRMYTEVLKEFE